MKIDKNKNDAELFAEILSGSKITDNILYFGKFGLELIDGVKDKINYNEDDGDLLLYKREFTAKLSSGVIQISLQLYENDHSHYRLFAFTRIKNYHGMTFSINLTTKNISDNIIILSQKIKFSERFDNNKQLVQDKRDRKQKQIEMSELLRKLSYNVTGNNDLIFGTFDTKNKCFVGTTPDKFLNDFIVIALLKGHFQGNKGFKLDFLDKFNKNDLV